METGEKSAEFREELKQALGLVREYVRMLLEDKKVKLSPKISRIASLDDAQLDKEAQNFALYHAEPIKTPGLYEFEQAGEPQLTPQQAVQNGELYLKLGERDLPERTEGTTGVPSLPWVEYGKNRWNRSHQLFGRYEAPTADGVLRVDFRLDSTHMPAKYYFFDTIEISKRTPEKISQHVILGQEVNREKEELFILQMFGAKLSDEELGDVVFPIILAGDFDFTNPKTRELLGKLAADKGAKPDVGRVIADVLRLSTEEKLQRARQS